MKIGRNLTLLLLLSTFFATAQVKLNPCKTENRAFKVGEKIVYKIYYHWNFIWMPAGEVSFRVFDKDNLYHIIIDGKTYSSYEWIYKVHHRYESFVDKETLLPRMFIRKTAEGKSTRYSRVEFDQYGNTVKNYIGKSEAEAKLVEKDIAGCMHDLVSVIYLLRNIDKSNFFAGNQVPVSVFYSKEEIPLYMYFHQKEEKKIKGQGKHQTIKFSPRKADGGLLEEDDMFIWVSDDENRVPLLIESPLSSGTVRAVLKESYNLKH